MPQWARMFVLLVGMTGWLAAVAVSLFLQQIPSAAVISIPAGLWLALSGGSKISQKRAVRKKTAADVTTDKEGDPA
jgi:glucose-6-phosphate-specific signal transduction histidine kinase